MSERLKIGISACFFHADVERPIFKGKTLQYVEQSIAHWVMSGSALPVLIPSPMGDTARGDVTVNDYAHWLDGLLLEGGSDVWPGSYGETALQPQWNGDRVRDEYEKALVHAFVAAGKPVFGVCRGLQMINVAFGGTLYQDIATQRPNAVKHRDAQTYDHNLHAIECVPGSHLAHLLAPQTNRTTNSIHHQAIKDLAPGFAVEARCSSDGVIEAIRRTAEDSWVAAVQWHPEFHRADLGTLDDTAILNDFLAAASSAKISTTQSRVV